MAFNSVKRSPDLGGVTLTKARGDSHINNDATFTGLLLLKICIISYQRRHIHHSKLPFGVKLLNSGSLYPPALLPAL